MSEPASSLRITESVRPPGPADGTPVLSLEEMVPESAPLSFRSGYRTKHQGDEKLLLQYTETRRAKINSALQSYLRWEEARPQKLPQAMSYAVLSDGKRIRPVLCGTGAEICGGSLDSVMPAACAIELIHAFSLVHDDLPALDNDELRRGRPSCHVKFGDAVAILAGDALFARAFGLLVEQCTYSSSERVMQALGVLTKAIGVGGMAGGQVEDLLAEGTPGDLETLEYVHSHKSGALIRASLVTGAILAGGSGDVIRKLAVFGDAIGHAFQIVDDILGETSDAPSLGKPVKNDQKRGKLTYPRLLGVKRSQAVAQQKLEEAVSAVRGLGKAANPLRWIATYVLARSR